MAAAAGFLIGIPIMTTIGLVLLGALLLDLLALLALMPDVSQGLIRGVQPARPHVGAPVTVTTTGIPAIGWRPGCLFAEFDEDLLSEGVFLRRGPGQLEAARVRFLSPLRAWRKTCTGPFPAPVIVAPQLVPMDTTGLVAIAADQAGKLGLPTEHLDDIQLREFVAGDELRRVAWRASAKAGKLLSRALEPSKERSVAVGVELGATPSEADEIIISLAASVVAAMAGEPDGGRSVELRIEGVPTDDDPDAQLDALALIGLGRPEWEEVAPAPDDVLDQVAEIVQGFWHTAEVVWR
jgi:uncharacterized protein (DUF58 family)